MSQRHRDAELPVPAKQELRAHAHGERHRIHAELSNVASQVSAGIDPADVHEPGTAWKPEHHRDPDVARSKLLNRSRSAPLEVKMWKRRTKMRRRGGSDAPRRRTALTGSARQRAVVRSGSSHRWRSSWAPATPRR